MSYFVVDVEADGPIPHKYSMLEFGAVLVEANDLQTFHSGKIHCNGLEYDQAAIESIGLTVGDYFQQYRNNGAGADPKEVMLKFEQWVQAANLHGRPIFVSDNNGFDFAWINWYFHWYLGRNIFGWSSRRIGDLYCGMEKRMNARWKHLRDTKHTHNPVDDAKDNAEALLKMLSSFNG